MAEITVQAQIIEIAERTFTVTLSAEEMGRVTRAVYSDGADERRHARHLAIMGDKKYEEPQDTLYEKLKAALAVTPEQCEPMPPTTTVQAPQEPVKPRKKGWFR